MINKPIPFKGVNIRIPIILPIQGRGFINQGSRLAGNRSERSAHKSRSCGLTAGSKGKEAMMAVVLEMIHSVLGYVGIMEKEMETTI